LHTPALEEPERVEELKRNLTHAHGDLAELRAERDQLRGRLQVALDEIASLKGVAKGLVVVPSIPAASSIAPVRAEMASVPVPASESTLQAAANLPQPACPRRRTLTRRKTAAARSAKQELTSRPRSVC
jgi:hypothetical protein